MWHFENMTPCFDSIEKITIFWNIKKFKMYSHAFVEKNAIYTSYCINLLCDEKYEAFYFIL